MLEDLLREDKKVVGLDFLGKGRRENIKEVLA